jgi:hypothetical protein
MMPPTMFFLFSFCPLPAIFIPTPFFSHARLKRTIDPASRDAAGDIVRADDDDDDPQRGKLKPKKFFII